MKAKPHELNPSSAAEKHFLLKLNGNESNFSHYYPQKLQRNMKGLTCSGAIML